MGSSSTAYQFVINGNNVTAVYEQERGRMKLERIDQDETWTYDGVNVIKTEFDDGRLETTTYSDVNGDGLFFKTGKTYSGTGVSHDYNGQTGISTPLPSYGENGYTFDIVGNAVTAVREVKGGRVKTERIDANESWSFDGADVTKTETGFGKVDITTYTDANLDGVFQKDFELEVLTGANPRALETFKFTLANGSAANGDLLLGSDTIAGMQELGRRGWKLDRIETNERLDVVEVGADSLILKTQTQWNGQVEFSVFRDDDGDGLWTEIADGKTFDAFVTLDGQVDLVGIADAGLLQAADLLVA